LIASYSFYYDLPDASSVGGVRIYVKDTLLHSIVDDYKMSSNDQCQVENLWIEVAKLLKTAINI